MGLSSSKNKLTKKEAEKSITSEEIKNLINISILKCDSYSNKNKYSILQKKHEIYNDFINNKKDLASAKMNQMLIDGNNWTAYELLKTILEIISEKCSYIVSSNECPEDLRGPLDSVLYAATRVEINELILFKDKIKKIYGEQYVQKAENNTDKLVNEKLAEFLIPVVFSEEIINTRINLLIREKEEEKKRIEDKKISPEPFIPPKPKDPFVPSEPETPYYPYYPFKASDYYKVLTQISSEINGLFSKTNITQIFSNPTDNPLELKIYIQKKPELIFSSFDCQIGDSIKVKSKIIKEEKAQEKYVDSISSGNTAIFVSHDPIDKDKIIIHMGNIPPKKDIIFISNFISPIETSNNKYQFELFRNLPIFQGKNNEIYQNSELKGEIFIKSKYQITNVQKNILMKNLQILEEKATSENPNIYTIKYEIKDLPDFYIYNPDYIPCSKIYYDLDNKEPLSLCQELNTNTDEKFYFIQYINKNNKSDEKNGEMFPSLFIFLLDQSISMSGNNIKIAKQALILFLQSLPVGSYYQIIGFGSEFKKYDTIPKEYNKQNIKESINIIENLEADLGGTDIYQPLYDVYNSNDYNDINLSKNIFLLTDGEVNDKSQTLEIIEKNNNKFQIFSIGIGENFDEDLIKNAGVIGRGNYNFCKELDKLNSIIVSEISKCCSPFLSNVKLDCNLDNKNIDNIIPNILRYNDSINLYYMTSKKPFENIKLNLNYKDEKNKEIKTNYEIVPEILEKGDDLSKLIMYNYINNNTKLQNEEKIKLALKYQIFIEGTSLFAEIELDNKISEQMKLEILGNQNQNQYLESYEQNNYKYPDMNRQEIFTMEFDANDGGPFGGCPPEHKNINFCKNSNEDIFEENIENKDNKEEFMKMINSQDFFEGYWEENDYTKKIIEKYEKEFKLIKDIKGKNIDDKTALTIVIIYFINKEHTESLNDLMLIIKKAKLFIQKVTNDTYENIIKEININ